MESSFNSGAGWLGKDRVAVDIVRPRDWQNPGLKVPADTPSSPWTCPAATVRPGASTSVGTRALYDPSVWSGFGLMSDHSSIPSPQDVLGALFQYMLWEVILRTEMRIQDFDASRWQHPLRPQWGELSPRLAERRRIGVMMRSSTELEEIKMSMCRIKAALTIAILGTVVSAAVPGSPATAGPLGVACLSGSQSQHNNPGLTFALQPTHITLNGQVSSCLDLTRPNRVSANFRGTGDGLASCLAGLLVTEVTYVWNDGGSSRIQFQAGVDLKPGGQSVVVVNGTVVAGDYAGRAAVKTITLLAPTDTTACLTEQGVTDVSGLTQLVIL